MTSFQVISTLVFLATLVAAYRNEVVAVVKKLVPAQAGEAVKPSIAITIVNDLISVTELRDKLAAENCPEGVEACTNLLRVIVEQTKPATNG